MLSDRDHRHGDKVGELGLPGRIHRPTDVEQIADPGRVLGAAQEPCAQLILIHRLELWMRLRPIVVSGADDGEKETMRARAARLDQPDAAVGTVA
jgi:hypothetical protein